MNSARDLDKALCELQKMTGIPLELQAKTPGEIENALTQVRCLTQAYREKYNKSHFLQSIMTDSIPPYDIYERALRLHIEPEASRILFLVETKNILEDTVSEIVRNLFPSQSKTYLIPMGEKSLAILRPRRISEAPKDISRLAHMIVDTLNMEALIHVQVAYSGTIGSLSGLSSAFKETSLAMRVGKLFYAGQTVFAYNNLGIGRLVYQLPVDICQNFLKEIFGSDIVRSFDEDITAAANKFLQNNLNIAETARQLHMHRNTLIYRLEQIEKKTGLDIRKFEDAMTFKVATMVINYLQTERNSLYE